ncbi:hypothetical protein AMELA_G00187360 [Ameiurus melas]|uniref:Uncharacterized protein n=1 Tax=Ameiurus melas TaxID=219545 RepID=A0A7J6A7X6_AMEME|nr:hypothetical protein AMELA_G00187360 [Ameiurus melas]
MVSLLVPQMLLKPLELLPKISDVLPQYSQQLKPECSEVRATTLGRGCDRGFTGGRERGYRFMRRRRRGCGFMVRGRCGCRFMEGGRRGCRFTRRRTRCALSRPQFCLNATTGFRVLPRHL